MVNLGKVVQDVDIKSRVHPFAWPACRKAPSASEKHLHGGESIDVFVMNAYTLETNVQVIKFAFGIVDEFVATGIR